MNFDNYILLKEDYKSQLQAFQRQGVAEDIALTYLNTHKIIKQVYANRLSAEEKNIDSFKTIDDLKKLYKKLRNDINDFENKVKQVSFEQAKTRFKGQTLNNQLATTDRIDDLINAYIGTLSSYGNYFPFPKNNINSFKNIQQLHDLLKNFKPSNHQNTNQTPDFPNEEIDDYDIIPEKAKQIYDDEKLSIYMGLSPEACLEIKGKHPTSWCVAQSDLSRNAYYGYRIDSGETNPTFYFIKNKEKTKEEGDNLDHQNYKDPFHFFVVQIKKDGSYVLTSANNDGDKKTSWKKIVEIEPLLADKKELLAWKPLTPNEELAKSMKQGVDLETFQKYSIKKKIMYVQTGKLTPEIWNTLSDELTLLAINRFRCNDEYQIKSLRNKPKLYKRWLDLTHERTENNKLYKEIGENYKSEIIKNFIKENNIDIGQVVVNNRYATEEMWDSFSEKEKLYYALKIKLTPKQFDSISANQNIFGKYVIAAIEKSKMNPEFYGIIADNIVKNILKGNLEETEKLIEEKYKFIVSKITPAFLNPAHMSNTNDIKLEGSVLSSLFILFNFITTYNNLVQSGFIEQGNIFEKELPKNQDVLRKIIFDYSAYHRGLGKKTEDWYQQYTEYTKIFCKQIHDSAYIIIKYFDSVGDIFKKNLKTLTNFCSNYKPKTYEPFQEPNKTGNRFSNESTKSFKVWLEYQENIHNYVKTGLNTALNLAGIPGPDELGMDFDTKSISQFGQFVANKLDLIPLDQDTINKYQKLCKSNPEKGLNFRNHKYNKMKACATLCKKGHRSEDECKKAGCKKVELRSGHTYKCPNTQQDFIRNDDEQIIGEI